MFISLTGDTQGLRLWLTRRQSWSQLLANMRIPCRIRSKWPRYQTTASTAMAAGLENGDGWHICQPTRKLWEGMLAKFVTYFVYSDGMGKLYMKCQRNWYETSGNLGAVRIWLTKILGAVTVTRYSWDECCRYLLARGRARLTWQSWRIFLVAD